MRTLLRQAGGDISAALRVTWHLLLTRYTRAQEALSYDVPTNTDMTLAPQIDPEKGIVEDLLLYLVADNNHAHYAKSFESLKIWVDNSLDLYKVDPADLP